MSKHYPVRPPSFSQTVKMELELTSDLHPCLDDSSPASPRYRTHDRELRGSFSSNCSSAPSFTFSSSASANDSSSIATHSQSHSPPRKSPNASLYFSHAPQSLLASSSSISSSSVYSTKSSRTSAVPSGHSISSEKGASRSIPTLRYSINGEVITFDEPAFDETDEETRDGDDEAEVDPSSFETVIYRAAAMEASSIRRRGEPKMRSGRAILKFRAGDLFDVFAEEADSVSAGGSGWLLGRCINTGEVGYSRTESLYIVD